jgi:glutamate/tyrosine decarboxylase-like PLP-dependent enzyme
MTGCEETLDPADWDELRRAGHRMVDDMLDYLASVRSRPAWQPVPESVKTALSAGLPLQPSPIDAVYEEFTRHVLPFPTGNIHPRFWGWVMGTGTPVAMLADMLASGMNAWAGGFDQSATLVEQQVIAWLAEMLGYPSSASGVLTAGCTAANIVGVALARRAKTPVNVREHGLQGDDPPVTVYGSTETHSWADKGVELLGIGSAFFRRIATDSAHRIELRHLREAVAADRRHGRMPICVIGTAGTVNTGASDDLQELARFCEDQQLWLHVDGAFGALAALSPRWRSAVTGLPLADSIGFDLHKWMYMPFEAGCLLVRDGDFHRHAFAASSSYMRSQGRGLAPQPPEFVTLGIDMARSFKALKIWMCLKTYGLEKYGRLIGQNIDQAHYLGSLVEADPRLELLAPVALNVVCFRFRGAATEMVLNDLNEEIVLRLQESGFAVPSMTHLDGRLAIRVAITNHRSRREDFDLLIGRVLELGSQLELTITVANSR